MSEKILEQLKAANREYAGHGTPGGGFSPQKRTELLRGQHPYAVIVTCSDSRVVPEAIFRAGAGELFVIRTAGNIVEGTELGSIEYAVRHLGTRTVVILGHTNCGAVAATLHGEFSGCAGFITKRIKEAIGEERDPDAAARLNVLSGVNRVSAALGIDAPTVVGAIYNLETGLVTFLN